MEESDIDEMYSENPESNQIGISSNLRYLDDIFGNTEKVEGTLIFMLSICFIEAYFQLFIDLKRNFKDYFARLLLQDCCFLPDQLIKLRSCF
jgi:hypothetical protein